MKDILKRGEEIRSGPAERRGPFWSCAIWPWSNSS